MLFKRKLVSISLKFVLLQVLLLVIFSSSLSAKNNAVNSFSNHSIVDTTGPIDTSLPFPIQDRRGDYLSNGEKNTYDLNDPSNIKDSIAYDPVTHLYTVYEKIGNHYYRTPTTYTFDEYWAMIGRQQEMDYFKKRANTMDLLNRNVVQPKLSLYDNLFNRLFGNGKIDITPQGNVDVTAGYQGQNIQNPTLPEAARKSGGLDFNMDAQVNVNANIGDKLKFPINYNTLANFGQENQLKLDYTGVDDEIVKRFEAGNVSFSTRSTLISGAQQLFGIKTQLQFGKLYVTGILANQKSQRQSVSLQGGAAAQAINLMATDYEENRHFFLAQYFRDNYNTVLANLPIVNSQVQILRMEVWVTNHVGTTTNARTVVGLADLGEDSTALPSSIVTSLGVALPSNASNNLYSKVISNPLNRQPSQVVTALQGIGLTPVQDFEKLYARKLDSTQYIFNAKVGYISLSQPLQSDEVLAVAYQYSYNGRIYQVGEFSQDVPPDTTTGSAGTSNVLFLKLLKATSQRPDLPIWKLMMKNVYSVGYGTLTPANFKLDILYEQPSLGAKRYVPFGDKNLGTPILSLLNLDKLNSNLDPQPDGIYDYVEGYTVISQYSRIVFPVLEPFGRDLAHQVYNGAPPSTVTDTLFYYLYDSIKAVAMQYPNLNRFQMKGNASTSGSSDISIGYNIPRGSVTVTAGGQTLVEGTDYDINYDLGTIKIINQAILNAGLPVQVSFENNATFGLQQRSYMGLRLDYQVKNTAKEQLSIGGTIVRLSERPFFTIVNYGEDPIRNTMYGLDASLKKDLPGVTKLLNKLPNYQTTTPTTINAYAEGAYFKPGHAPQIGSGSAGAVYIDDFEGSESGIDLRFPAISWALASTPDSARDENGNVLFPEAGLSDNLAYGMNRAKIAWYQIEPNLQLFQGSNNPIGNNAALLSDPRTRIVYQNEIFPQITTDVGQSQLVTFDLAYYPKNKGPYNYDATNINSDNTLKNPQTRWGGLMRSLDQTDFVTANVEYIEFWMQDPYISSATNPAPGKLYFNLGDISEDILKDGDFFYENGLPTPNVPAQVDTSVWGRSPANPVQPVNGFSTDPTDRLYQDVGLDGLSDDSEKVWRAPYINQLKNVLTPAALQTVENDPSLDDYKHYLDPSFTSNDGILARYKNFNNPEGNSPINNGSAISTAATLYPDKEDINNDNTMNEAEQYFQYMVNIADSSDPSMQIGSNFIVDRRSVIVATADGKTHDEAWYQFRIPIGSYNSRVGSPDFNSIRFMRMFLTGFSDSIVLRFGELQLSRNTWRNFQYNIDTTGNYNAITDPASFVVGAVNIEQNDQRVPFPYRTPKEIQRQQVQSNNGVNLLLNEQSMTLQFCDLGQGDSRGAFETFPQRDFRSYGNLSMFIHAEADPKLGANLHDTDMVAVVRIGSDFVDNYYEVRIPLYLTPLSAASLNPDTDAYNDTLWRAINNLNLDLTILPKLKEERNLLYPGTGRIYSKLQPNGQTYSIMGEPNLGDVEGVLIGVQNVHAPLACGQIWVDELRLLNINEHGGYASTGKVDMNLADLGTVSASAATHSAGFGTLEQDINARFKDNYTQFDVAANLELGKLLPKKAAISIPVLASYTQSVSMPEYDPYDGDIKLQDKLNGATSTIQKDSIRNAAVTFNSTKTINFTNVHKNKTNNKKPKIYDITNFDISYSFIQINEHDPLTAYNNLTRQRANIGYNFAPKPAYIEPFKKLKFFKKNKSHWFDLVKDFNFNLIPSQLSFRTDITKQFGVTLARSIGASNYSIPETYNSYFIMERDYIFRWNLTRSLNFNLNAVNNSRVDEPYGRIDTKAKRDTIWQNFLKGGRNTLYNQTTDFSYTLPTSKFPLTDFATINLKYQATYNWIGASLLAVSLGNILENGQQQEATAQFDLTKVYNKFRWLRSIDKPQKNSTDKNDNNITTKTDTIFHFVKRDDERVKEIKRIRIRKITDPNASPDVSTFGRIVGKLITSVKQINFSVSENANTRLPGYTDSTQYVGEDWRSMAPGLGFILGQQPDTGWLNRAAQKGLITKDTTFNDLFQQTYSQRLTLSAQVVPVKDLNISINLSKSFNKNYSETYKYSDTAGQLNYQFNHLSPYAGGGFDISYISFKTLFGTFDPNKVSQTFLNFESYRLTLSNRLGKLNPNSSSSPAPGTYSYGYSQYSTDVLIPAFIAAYSGKDPNKVALINETNPNIKSNPFGGLLPEPNWKLDYSGLSKIKGLDKIFSSITISHGYTGDLSMNGFTSALIYTSKYDYPSFYDTTSKSFVPYFLIPNITIQEQFAPLIGIDMTLKNKLQAKFEFIKQRILSLSLIDYQLSETRSTSFSVGAGYKKKGMKLLAGIKLPKFLSKSGSSKLDNEINFRLDVKVQDNVTSNSILDQNENFATSGSKEITISPTIDYYLNSKINVKLYFDQRRVIPYVSSSAPITTTRAGVQVRISLAP